MKINEIIHKLLGLSQSKSNYKFKSEELEALSGEYARADDSLEVLVNRLQNDERLKKFASESELDCVMNTEDFYKYLRGTSIILENGKFIIYNASGCGFPDYVRAQVYELTAISVEKNFPCFTPQMFKEGMQRYIKILRVRSYGKIKVADNQ